MRTEQVKLVSLGDSIATGTLTPFQGTASYVYYLRRKFQQEGYQIQVSQLAADGDTSRDLLRKLNHSQQFCSRIEQADVITVSIGGNDLLKASSIPGFKSINRQVAKQGTKRFCENWPEIAARLRSINPRAGIVVLNVYNPYNDSKYLGRNFADRGLCEVTDEYLGQINETIGAHAPGNYAVADVYGAFKQYAQGKMGRVTCMYPDSVLRNPHPTPYGQRMIADLIMGRFALNINL